MEQFPKDHNDPLMGPLQDLINTFGQPEMPESRAYAHGEDRTVVGICQVISEANQEGIELAGSTSEYDEMLRQAGLRFEADLDKTNLVVVDPIVYTAALQRTPTPENSGSGQVVSTEVGLTLQGVVEAFGVARVIQGYQTIASLFGGIVPVGSSVVGGARLEGQSSTPPEVTMQLPALAGTLAQEGRRLGVHEDTIRNLESLAIAHEEGLVDEWCAAYDLGMIGEPEETAIGVDRLCRPEEWQAAYNFLAHLARSVPQAQLTRLLRDQLLGDINTQLSTPASTHVPRIQKENPTGDPKAEIEYFSREAAAKDSQGLLRQAQARIPHILP